MCRAPTDALKQPMLLGNDLRGGPNSLTLFYELEGLASEGGFGKRETIGIHRYTSAFS